MSPSQGVCPRSPPINYCSFSITIISSVYFLYCSEFSWRLSEISLFLYYFFLIFLFIIYLFYLWLCWVFVSVRGLFLVAASGGHSSSRCAGLSLSWPLLLRSTGSRRAGSVIVSHGPSCSTACGIFPDQDSNPCPLHWQADSQPLCHQGSPPLLFFSCLPQFPWSTNSKGTEVFVLFTTYSPAMLRR